MKKGLKMVALGLSLSLLLTSGTGYVDAAKKTTIATKTIKLKVKKTKKIVLKNANKKAKYTFKSSKTSVAKVSAKGLVTAKKAGTASILVIQTLKKKTTKIGTVKVIVSKQANKGNNETVVESAIPSATPSETPAVSAAPVATAATDASATPSTSEAPTTSPVVSEAPASTKKPLPEVTIQEKVKRSDILEDDDAINYGEVVKTTYYSSITKKDRNVIIILPGGYTKDKEYPVLYMFHGGMADETDWYNAGHMELLLGNMINQGLAKEMIIVLPNCRCRENDSAANITDGLSAAHVQSFDVFKDDFKENLVPFIKENYSVAEGRYNTAVAGMSMGGRVALNIGLSMPEEIGYIGAFCPAFGLLPYTNNGLTEDGLFTEETMTLPAEYKDDTLIIINAGNQDNMVKDEPERYSKALKANGVPHTFYKTDGGHGWDVWHHGIYNYLKYLF